MTSSVIHMIILLRFNYSFSDYLFSTFTDFSDSVMTLEIRKARILQIIVFCFMFLRDNKPKNALGACNWNFLVLNAATFSSGNFESESVNGNFDKRLLLKRGIPEFSQTPRQCQPSTQLKLHLCSILQLGSLEFNSSTDPHFSSNR